MVLEGCATHTDRLRLARDQFYANNLEQSDSALSAQLEKPHHDADVLALDLAVVRLMEGHPQQAERQLREVRDHFDTLEGGDAMAGAVSLVTDDQRLRYAGEDYEKVLIRVFLALSNLMYSGQDAEAYSLQVNALQQQLLQHAVDQEIENAQQAYQPLAIGPYLHGLLREATFHDYDDAARAYGQVVAWRPDFRAGPNDLARAQHGVHSQPKHGVLYLFVLVDRGPVKVEAVEEPTSAALLIADRIVSAAGQHELPPTVAPVKVPRVVVPPRQSDGAVIVIDGQAAAMTEPICDIGQLALRQQEVQYPHIIARAVARRVIKKTGIYATKDYLNTDQAPWADLALTVAGIAWEATESADTRCWGLLPREIQVLRIELPVGSHQLRLRSTTGNSTVEVGQEATISILDGRNTYALAYIVGQRMIGQLLLSTP